ncbi:MAG: S8 family serine peptidase [Planctomycetes bacterium]|nr:S8 family serine peptidase [Planctomycetota bacterium]
MPAILDELRDADGSGVRVAIVDSGVEADHAWVGGRLVESYGLTQADGGDYRVVEVEPRDVFGHGTAAAGQVRRFAPAADLVSIRILGETLQSTSQSLLAALRWLKTQKVHVVNLSLSTMRVRFALHIGHAVDDLYARGAACVCARGYHRTGRAYPTSFAGTIGVAHKKLPAARLEFRPHDLVEFNAAGGGMEVAWRNGQTRVVEGSSYACALVTGLAARLLSVRPGLAPYEVKGCLKAYALRQAEGWWDDWMQRVEQAPAIESQS